MNPLNEEQIETLLRRLPHFKPGEKVQRAVLQKLQHAARKPWQQPSEKILGWFGWPRFALASSVAILLLFAVGTVWAYQPGITRGHFLYPWKQTGERVELAFASSPLKRIETHLRFSDRRLEEAQRIIEKNPLLAGFAPAARAHEDGTAHLETKDAVRFADTLADMKREVLAAQNIVESAVRSVDEIDRALEKIEATTDRHLDVLERWEKQAAEPARLIVQQAFQDHDMHLAAVIEAREAVDAAREKKLTHLEIKILKREEKWENRREKAREKVQEIKRIYKQIHEPEKKTLEEIEKRAEKAMEEGKFGRVEGLARTIKNRLKKEETGRAGSGETKEPAEKKTKQPDIFKKVLLPEPSKTLPSTEKKEKTEVPPLPAPTTEPFKQRKIPAVPNNPSW